MKITVTKGDYKIGDYPKNQRGWKIESFSTHEKKSFEYAHLVRDEKPNVVPIKPNNPFKRVRGTKGKGQLR